MWTEATRENRLAILTVPAELLRSALHLPAETQVLALGASFNVLTDEVYLRISHPDFAPLEEGQAIPKVEAFFHCYGMTASALVVFEKWVF